MDEPQSWDALIGNGQWEDPAARRGRFDWLTLGSAVFTFALICVLVMQVVFIGIDETQDLSFWDIAGYWVTATVTIGVQVALLVRVTRLRRPGLQVIATLALIGAVGVSLVLSVPPMVGKSEAPEYTTPPGYEPCYSGSGDCIGG